MHGQTAYGSRDSQSALTMKAVSKFLKELSRKFLVMICMTQNRRSGESLISTTFFGMLLFLILSTTFVDTHSLKHDVTHECFP